MLEQISMALSSLNAAKDIAKGIDSLEAGVAINQAKIDLQTLILAAQEGLFAAQEAQTAAADRIQELEQQLADFENWDSEKERYYLKAINPGAFAYVYKLDMDEGEEPVWLCQTCFEERHWVPLQFSGEVVSVGGGGGLMARWGCGRCKNSVMVGRHDHPVPAD